MANETTLGEKITSRLQQHKRDLAQQQQQLDSRMKDLLEEREQLASVGKVWIEKVILPRLKELEKYFDNGKVEILNLDSNLSCACEFAHTTRFPATVRLNISLLPGNGYLTARYDLTILPVLMEYTLTVEEKFSIEGDEEALAICRRPYSRFHRYISAPGNASALPERQYGGRYCLWNAHPFNLGNQ
ncbi:hypothetical protein [Geotalea toluenoxydans]|uniref:hypothetical protein n=1 Tax=Geotalea toluenoxydans TaxID=421624 RepID=UPI000B283E75|nr:hypothetical protein [Geotalea toluenoxydans]